MKENGMKIKIPLFCCAIVLLSLLFISTLGMASSLSIQVQTPQSGMQVSEEVPIKVLIKEGDKPLTVKEGLHWASAVLSEESGREILRIALQDNGKGEDEKANDGYWSSPWKIKLPQGRYSLFVLAKRDKELIYSPKLGFSVIPTKVIEPKEKMEEPFYKEIMGLSSKVDGTRQTVLIAIVLISAALLIVGAGMLILIFKGRKTKESPPIGERWGPILTALDEAGKKISETEKDISSTFHVHREIKDRYEKLSKDIVDIYDFAMGWVKAPSEYIEPFRAKLWKTLERQGVEKWEPEIGKPPPENCEKEPASKDYPYPAGSVAEVLSPGFRIKEGGKLVPVKPPSVIVVTEKVSKEM